MFAAEGGYQAVHKGYEIGGDIIFQLTPRFGVGIGGGYLRVSKTSRMTLDFIEYDIAPYITVQVKPRLSAVPIRAGIYLTLPFGTRFHFHAEIGASYYLSARYSDEWWRIVWSMDMATSYTYANTDAKVKKTPVGFQGGIGLEFKLKNSFFLFLDAFGRYARFRGLKGSSSIELYTINDEPTLFTEQGILYYEVVSMLDWLPRLIMVQSAPPDGPDGEPRQAVVDFSGISLQIGIRIRL